MTITLPTKKLLEREYFIKSIIKESTILNPFFDIKGRDGLLLLMTNGIVLQDYNQDNDTIAIINKFKMEIEEWRKFNTRLRGINPVLNYNEVSDKCKVISEDNQTKTVEFGRYPTECVKDMIEVRELLRKYRQGEIVETGEKVLISVNNDGTKQFAKIYRYKSTGIEYTFISVQGNNKLSFEIDDISVNDIRDEHARVGIVKPVRWKVDKQSNTMISIDTLFLTNFFGDYSRSELKRFLEERFLIDCLGLYSQYQKNDEIISENDSDTSLPWTNENTNQTLTERIQRILKGKNRIPYVVGHPGVGKTAIVKSLNKNILAYNISTFTPDTFAGKTVLVPGKTRTYTDENGYTVSEGIEAGITAIAKPEWYVKLLKLSKECENRGERCILFLDEFDKLTPNLQVFINGVVDNPRTIANFEIPDNVDIVFAGNTEEYSDAAFQISGEVESRLVKIEADVKPYEWISWACENDIDPIIRAYISLKPDELLSDARKKDGSYDYSKSLTPRSWDQKINTELKISRQLGTRPQLDNYMTDLSRSQFEEFIDYYFKLQVEDIVNGNLYMINIYNYTDPEIQTIIAMLAAIVITDEQLKNAFEFIKLVYKAEYKSLFSILWTKIHSNEEDLIRIREAETLCFEEEKSGEYGK